MRDELEKKKFKYESHFNVPDRKHKYWRSF